MAIPTNKFLKTLKYNGNVIPIKPGTEGIPVATKGTVSNHSIVVTPSVENAEGYIEGGTKNGTPVTVTASELVSGSETKTENGTYDVTNLASLVVNCPTGSGIQYSTSMGKATNKTSYTAVGGTITVEETGNYKCSWVAFAYAAGSSSTYATQLYKGSTAVGSVHNAAAYNGSSGFVAVENSIALTAGQTIGVRARTRSGTSYWTVAGMLVIEKL